MGFDRSLWLKALYRAGIRGPLPERKVYFIGILIYRRLR